jgi:uncharacterized protein YgfB (UPF0149 family)
MVVNRRVQIDIATARYLEAVEGCNPELAQKIRAEAGSSGDVLEAFRQLDAGLAEEQRAADEFWRELMRHVRVAATLTPEDWERACLDAPEAPLTPERIREIVDAATREDNHVRQ